MSKRTEAMCITGEGDSELELSAQELRELGQLASVGPAEGKPPLKGDHAPPAASLPLAAGGTQTTKITRGDARRSATASFAVNAALVLGALAAAGALYLSSQSGAEPSFAAASLSAGMRKQTAELIDPAREPVLFANPFDPTEVFEFPPGTSASSARERVAHALIERASQRQLHAMHR